jgi:uncharacterized protein YkwD
VYALRYPNAASATWKEMLVQYSPGKLSSIEDVLLFINNYRKSLGLPKLACDRKLHELARLAAANGDALHDTRLVHDWLRIGHNQQSLPFRLIGENKVESKDLADALFLMWLSPRHRQLLIDGQGTRIGIYQEEIRNMGILLSLVLAAEKAAFTISSPDKTKSTSSTILRL